jgi:hypothetical protein
MIANDSHGSLAVSERDRKSCSEQRHGRTLQMEGDTDLLYDSLAHFFLLLHKYSRIENNNTS